MEGIVFGWRPQQSRRNHLSRHARIEHGPASTGSTTVSTQPSVSCYSLLRNVHSRDCAERFHCDRGFLRSNIDTDATLWQLVLYCFLTGFTTAPTFLACYIWCGFQRTFRSQHLYHSRDRTDPLPKSRAGGGLVQLSLAVARLFATSDHTFYKGDQQALASLLSFLIGVSFGRIGDHVGVKKRWWLMTATSVMGLMTLAATLCAHFSGEPSIAE